MESIEFLKATLNYLHCDLKLGCRPPYLLDGWACSRLVEMRQWEPLELAHVHLWPDHSQAGPRESSLLDTSPQDRWSLLSVAAAFLQSQRSQGDQNSCRESEELALEVTSQPLCSGQAGPWTSSSPCGRWLAEAADSKRQVCELLREGLPDLPE